MSAATTIGEEDHLHPRVAIAQVGSWWTFDAPSLRVPTDDGVYVSIWSVGVGPSVLFLTEAGGHNFWVPAFPELTGTVTLHAVDLAGGEDPAAGIAVAAEAVGARAIVASGPMVTAAGSAGLPVVDVTHDADPDDRRATPELGALIKGELGRVLA